MLCGLYFSCSDGSVFPNFFDILRPRNRIMLIDKGGTSRNCGGVEKVLGCLFPNNCVWTPPEPRPAWFTLESEKNTPKVLEIREKQKGNTFGVPPSRQTWQVSVSPWNRRMFGPPPATRSPSSALLPFWGAGSPTKIDYRKRIGHQLILTSLLKNQVPTAPQTWQLSFSPWNQRVGLSHHPPQTWQDVRTTPRQDASGLHLGIKGRIFGPDHILLFHHGSQRWDCRTIAHSDFRATG